LAVRCSRRNQRARALPDVPVRWRVLGGSNRDGKGSGRAIYIHHFVGDDWSLDLHDHPKRFISIGLWDSYVETTKTGRRVCRAPWIRSFPATHAHRIQTPCGSYWTLVITSGAKREWGFWHEGIWYSWRDYVQGNDSGLADKMKSCA
jgi:hypothetical protein